MVFGFNVVYGGGVNVLNGEGVVGGGWVEWGVVLVMMKGDCVCD